MADKSLEKMNRAELIEIIYAQQQNEQALRDEMAELRDAVAEKLMSLEKVGSLAEAALALNHVFKDADAAVQQYLSGLRYAEERAAQIVEDAQRRAAEIVAQAEDRARQVEVDARHV